MDQIPCSHGVSTDTAGRRPGRGREDAGGRRPRRLLSAAVWAAQPGALRPLGAGERIDAAIKLVRGNFLTLAKASLVIAVPSGIVLALVTITLAGSSGSVTTLSPSGTRIIHTGRLFTLFGGLFLETVVSYLVTILVTAACFRIIGNAYLGQPAEWKEALRFGLSRIWAIIWVSLLVTVAALLPVGILGGIIALAAQAHDQGAAVAVGVALGLALLVAEIWFLTATRLAVPIVMLEDIRGVKAVRRSISLCRSHWWSVFGTQLLALLLVGVAGTAVGVILRLPLAATHNTAATFVGDLLSSTISLAVFTPFTAAVLVVITIDLRVRKEGFDIQLLASRMGLQPTSSAAGFIRPPAGWGYGGSPGPGGYPSGPPGYPQGPPGYPSGYPGPGGYPAGPGGYPAGPGPGAYPGGAGPAAYPGRPGPGGYPGGAGPGGYPSGAGGYAQGSGGPPGQTEAPPGHEPTPAGWESTGWTPPPPPPGYGWAAEQPPYGAPPAPSPPYGAPPPPGGPSPGWPAPSPKRPPPPRAPSTEKGPRGDADDEAGSPGSPPPPAGAE